MHGKNKIQYFLELLFQTSQITTSQSVVVLSGKYFNQAFLSLSRWRAIYLLYLLTRTWPILLLQYELVWFLATTLDSLSRPSCQERVTLHNNNHNHWLEGSHCFWDDVSLMNKRDFVLYALLRMRVLCVSVTQRHLLSLFLLESK